jgi:hypothetical protein
MVFPSLISYQVKSSYKWGVLSEVLEYHSNECEDFYLVEVMQHSFINWHKCLEGPVAPIFRAENLKMEAAGVCIVSYIVSWSRIPIILGHTAVKISHST